MSARRITPDMNIQEAERALHGGNLETQKVIRSLFLATLRINPAFLDLSDPPKAQRAFLERLDEMGLHDERLVNLFKICAQVPQETACLVMAYPKFVNGEQILALATTDNHGAAHDIAREIVGYFVLDLRGMPTPLRPLNISIERLREKGRPPRQPP